MVVNSQSVRIPEIFSTTVPDLEARVGILTTEGNIRNGPCFVYLPISNPSSDGPTHTLDWARTRKCSRGWSEKDIIDFMGRYGQPTEITFHPDYSEK